MLAVVTGCVVGAARWKAEVKEVVLVGNVEANTVVGQGV